MNKYLPAICGASALAVMGTGTARAVPSYAYADLHFQNFFLTGLVNSSGAPLPGITLTSSSVTSIDSANYPGALSASNSAGGGLATGTDATQATSGPGSFPSENTFTQALLPANALTPAGTRGDVQTTGSLAGGVTSNLVSEGKLSDGGVAASSSGMSVSIGVTTSAVTTINLTFAASSALAAQIGQALDSATASVNTEFRVYDATTNSYRSITDNINAANSSNDIRPSALNANASTTDPLVIRNVTTPLTAYSYTATLPAGQNFLITFTDGTQVQEVVPEPLTLSIFGSGLVALGVIRRRRGDRTRIAE